MKRNGCYLLAFAFGAATVAVRVSLGQTGDLRADLQRLEVRHSTAHYQLSGTVSKERFDEYGRCLEYIYAEYSRGFGELIDGARSRRVDAKAASKKRPGAGEPPLEPESPFKVVIFADQASYDEFARAYFQGFAEHTRGLFVPGAELLLIRDEPHSEETYETLFHEAFHQFFHRNVPLAPVWLNEGLAVHYGTARPTESGLVYDRFHTGYFDAVETGALNSELIPLRELLNANSLAFYNREAIGKSGFDRRALCYAQSYTLVAHMLFDDDGREHLRAYVRRLAGARTAADAARITEAAFPDSLLDRLVPGWIEFVRRH